MGVNYFAGAETGDLSELAATTGSVSAYAGINVHAPGVYSYLINGLSMSSGITFTTGLNAPASYLRFWLNISAVPSPSALSLVQVRDSTETLLGRITLSVLGQLQALAAGGTMSPGTMILAYNVWYLIECKFVTGTGANAIMEVRVGGAVQASCSNGTAVTNADNWTVGAGSNMFSLVDDVLIRNDQYPGDGRCLARQGTSGAPTYTAWTEVGGFIYVVWSNTPYNATQYAVATAANQNQSMLIAAFTPGGIGPIDTINAVKVGAVGNLASAGGTNQTLLMRFNGVNQSSGGLGLTTATAYTEFYPATLPTVAQLNSCQGGAMQGTSTNFLQIDDLWVMADFTPVWFDEMPTNNPIFEGIGITSYG
jgi:hypothetical protein